MSKWKKSPPFLYQITWLLNDLLCFSTTLWLLELFSSYFTQNMLSYSPAFSHFWPTNPEIIFGIWKKPELGSWLHDEFQLLALLFMVYKGTHFTNTHFSGTQISLHCFFHALNFPSHSFFLLCFFQQYFFLSLNFRAPNFRTLNFLALQFLKVVWFS